MQGMNLRRLHSLLAAWLVTVAVWLAAGPAVAQSWLDTRAGIEERHAAGDVEGATALGDEYLSDIREDFGPTSPVYIDSLMELAALDVDLGEPAVAVERITDVIGILGPIEAPNSSRLMDAYMALGDAYAEADLNPLAIEAYEQARDLSRRRLGLYNTQQIDILYGMSRAALNEGDVAAAAGFRQDAQDIYVRSRLETLRNAPEMQSTDPALFLAARLAYGNALIAEGLVTDAMLSYAETLEIIEDEFGKSSRMRASVLLAQSEAVGANLTTLQRARRTINFMIEPDPLLRAELRREWGDWRMLAGLPEKAERAYRDSWRILETIDGGEELQRDWFGQLEYIREPGHGLLGAGILTLDPDAPLGEVTLEFFVDSTGRAQNIRVVRANPEWMTGIAARQVASSLFRPRFVDGDLVTTAGRFTWSFRYDQEVAELLGVAPPSVIPDDTPPAQ
jgi:tetratricopeptide (TPR) repeat protein